VDRSLLVGLADARGIRDGDAIVIHNARRAVFAGVGKG